MSGIQPFNVVFLDILKVLVKITEIAFGCESKVFQKFIFGSGLGGYSRNTSSQYEDVLKNPFLSYPYN